MKFSITRIVSQREEQADTAGEWIDHVAVRAFVEAYAQLRRACPRGDLTMHLSVEEPK